jgi:hypothetical protein
LTLAHSLNVLVLFAAVRTKSRLDAPALGVSGGLLNGVKALAALGVFAHNLAVSCSAFFKLLSGEVGVLGAAAPERRGGRGGGGAAAVGIALCRAWGGRMARIPAEHWK